MRRIGRGLVRFFRLLDDTLEILIFDRLLAPPRRGWVLGGAGLAVAGLLIFAGAPPAELEPQSSALPVADEATGAKRLLLRRPWLDHLPTDPYESYRALIFEPKGVGVKLRATAYKGQWEMFLFRANDKEVRFFFPHDKKRFATQYSISKIQRGTFDLELTLENMPKGPKTYYSWKKFRRGEDQPPALRSMALERWLVPVERLGEVNPGF